MKILITGAKGMMGSDLMKVLSQKKEYNLIGASRSDFDVTDYSQTLQFLKDKRPDIVIHAAAYTKVDDCESHSETAYKVNETGTKNISSGCKDINAKLIYISTDYIFNGKKNTPYLENDMPEPLSVYGDSKLKGELAVQDILNDFIIVRTSWLFGKNGNNFISAILKQVDKAQKDNSVAAAPHINPYVRGSLRVVNDQTGSPTYTIDLSQAIEKLITCNAKGIFNVTNSGHCSWYQFAKKILELAGIKGVEVVPIKTNELNRPAQRPAYSVLDCTKFKNTTNYQMRHWEETLKDYLSR